jgi:hypothetical protein
MNRPGNAMPYLDWAIQRSPGLQAAYYNRALADYQNCLLYESTISPGQTDSLPNDAIRDINMAIQIGPVVAELYHRKADICAYAARRDTHYLEPMCQAIEMALRLGQPSSSFRDGPRDCYHYFASNARFQKAKCAVPVRASTQMVEQFLEPAVASVAQPRTAAPAQ